MGKQELDNLVKIQKLKADPASRKEFDGRVGRFSSEDIHETLFSKKG